MIHATDHPEGPLQMARAYRNTVRPSDSPEDTQSGLFIEPKEPELAPGEPMNKLSA
jgi:hypothetical protein